MASIFSLIISGDIPSYKIDENEWCYAFLDINPVKRGHTLVVPKIETDVFFQQEDRVLEELIIFSKKIASAIEKAIPCNRIGMTVIGLEVPHAHIHLVPIDSLSDMNFAKPKHELSPEELESIAEKIRTKLT